MEYQQIAAVAQQAADIARARGLNVIVNSGPFEVESPMLTATDGCSNYGITDLALRNCVTAGMSASDIAEAVASAVAKETLIRRSRQ